MKVVQFAEYGGPEVLTLADVPEPHASRGRVRIAVRAAGVNAFDWKQRSGMVQAPSLPYVPGFDAAGVVDETGEGVSDVAIGDAVFGVGSHTYAEHAVLRVWERKPAEMSWAQAASLPTVLETAARGLREVGVKSGSVVVINGASGGVGTAAVQLAVGSGAVVIGVASPKNADYLKGLGAVPVSYGPGLVDRVRAVTDRVTAAFDVSGSGVIPELIELTGDAQQVVSIADWNAGQYGAKVSGGAGNQNWEALATVTELFSEGKFKIEVQATYPLGEADEAHRVLQDGHVRGKLVLEVAG